MAEPVRQDTHIGLLESWKERLKEQNWRVIFAFGLLTVVLTGPIYYHRIYSQVESDYLAHIAFTQQLLWGDPLDPVPLSHPALQLVLAAMFLATGKLFDLRGLLLVLQVVVQVITVFILYNWFGKAKYKGWDAIRAGMAVSLTFVAPVMLLVFVDDRYYLGYIGLANYHNPTIHLLQPVALLSFFYAIKAMDSNQSSWKSIALAAFWMTLSTWIKPNYAISILPALALVAGIRWLHHRLSDIKMLVWGFAFPGIFMLGIQFLITYHPGTVGEGISLAPLVVLGAYSGSLLVKFVFSCLFPLVILVFAWRSFPTNSGLLLAWAGFIAGAAQMYLLAETGNRMYGANFAWSAQIMLFLLFAASARWLLREQLAPGGMKLLRMITLYGYYFIHVAAGIIYYIYLMTSVHYS